MNDEPPNRQAVADAAVRVLEEEDRELTLEELHGAVRERDLPVDSGDLRDALEGDPRVERARKGGRTPTTYRRKGD